MSVFENVKREAEKQNISIAALEVKAGVANGTISGWKTGKPYLETASKVATALGVTVDELILREE